MDGNWKIVPDHFCTKPFNYAHTNVSGKWKPCCKSNGTGQEPMSFEEWWFENDWLNGLRDELLTEPGEIMREHCGPCFDFEAIGTKSYRQYALEKDLPSTLDVIKNYKQFHYPISNTRFLYIKPKGFGNHCNLACYMCPPNVSSSRRTEVLKLDDESFDALGVKRKSLKKNNRAMVSEIAASEMRNLVKDYGSIIKTINLSGGEPTMIPGLLELLDLLVESGHSEGINLFMNSNLTKAAVLENKFLQYVDKFKHCHISGSIDHVNDKDEWIRYPSKFDDVIKAATYLNGLPNVYLDINITWSLLNVEDADEIVSTIEGHGLKLSDSINFVRNPAMLHVSNHPNKDSLDIKYEPVLKELNKPFNELLFHQACAYIKDLDRVRGTNAKELWTWLV